MSDGSPQVVQGPGRLGGRLGAWVRPLRRAATAAGAAFTGTRGRLLRVAVVVVLAAAGYVLFIPHDSVDRGLLGGLVIDRTALSTVPRKASVSQSVAPSQSTFAVTRAAAKHDPDATGMFAREWDFSSSGPPDVGIVMQLLPNEATARRVDSDVVAQLHTVPTLTGETAVTPENFSVPGLAGARGVSYTLDDSTTLAPIGTSYTADYQVGSAVVSELMVTTSTTRNEADIDKDVKAGARLLQITEPGFSMMRTSLPLVASLIYAGATLAVAAGAFFGPETLVTRSRRRRHHRHEREIRRAREQYMARGRRTVRRQRAPAWSQPRRR